MISGDMDLILTNFLFDYRTTPQCTTGKSPAFLLFGRPLRTRFNLFREEKEINERKSGVERRVAGMQAKQKYYYRGKTDRIFNTYRR